MDDLPLIPIELVEALERLFPNRLPDVTETVTMEEINILRGRADVIDLLRTVHDLQNNPPEEDET